MQQERTEEPTQRRRERARREGESPRSALLGAAFSLLAAVILASAATTYAEQWLSVCAGSLHASAQINTPLLSGNTLPAWLHECVANGARFSFFGWFVSSAASVASAAVTGAIFFAPASIASGWRRLSIRNGLRRLASAESALNAATGALCVAAIVVLLLPVLRSAPLLQAMHLGFFGQAATALATLRSLWQRLCAVVLMFGCLDLFMQRRRHQARLRMTQREVKEDRAESETRPEIKQRRRAVGAKRARGVRVAAIRRASAVITNPTRIAVALRYAPPAVDVPMVVARGADRAAALIREVAASHDIPVVESADLARRLYAQVDLDDSIPEDCYAAVAAVFAWIVKTTGTLRRGDDGEPA